MKRLRLTPEADFDVTEAHGWYHDQAAELAVQFVRAVDTCMASIRQQPEAYPLIDRTMRRALLRRFPHAVFFEVGRDRGLWGVPLCPGSTRLEAQTRRITNRFSGPAAPAAERVVRRIAVREGAVTLTRKRRSLLIEMEGIIGSQCWNSRSGQWDEGRRFRYPIQFPERKGSRLYRRVTSKISDAKLLKGHYVFGANKLFIFRALNRVLEHLEKTHVLRLEDGDELRSARPHGGLSETP